MAEARLLEPDERTIGPRQSREGLSLARRLPQLVVAARDVASTVMHGVHGRRRAGIGETFWQFRPFTQGESTARIDWRRSARDERVYIREHEWESAHTVQIWIDRSPSMAFVSQLARQSKLDRALVLGLATADLLVRGGERVGMPGLMRPIAHRAIIDRMAEALILDERRHETPAKLPPADPLPPRTQGLLIGDFLSPAHEIATAIEALSARGAAGHCIMVSDPVEDTFPFSGHTELLDVGSPARLRLGEARALRQTYLARLEAHRDAVRQACMKRGWSLALHRTDRPASEVLLALRMRLENAGVR